ncbi:MAG: Gx transporter family protein [Oscillospiraceae bacterium]|nr:Gx transporter family protein [Oscillospiraceae bacterium]
MKTKRLVFLALLTAVALSIYLVEAQIPVPIPVAGVKLGLANIVTLFALCMMGPWDALTVLLLRCFLGSLFSGQMVSFLYSVVGGILSWAVMLGMRRITTERQIFIVSIVGSIFHNLGQILVAMVVTGTPGILYYLPVLLISGIVAGAFTGIAAQYLMLHLNRLKIL